MQCLDVQRIRSMALCKEHRLESLGTNPLDISVVIPAYNSMATIGKCLDSIRACGPPQPREVIVVDSGTDGTAKLLKRHYPWVQYYHHHNRLLPGAARNLGWRHATGGIIAFLDSDCMAEKDWLKNMAEAHSRHCDVVTGSFDMAKPQDPFGFLVFCSELAASLPGHSQCRVRLTPAGNSSYKRHVLEKTGGFRGDIFCEDTILAAQLIRLGYRIQFDPNVKVCHINREGYLPFKTALFRSGFSSGMARKRFKMKGSLFARFPVLIPLLIPYRCANIYHVNRKGKNPHQSTLLRLFPLLFWGMIIWGFAFYKGVRSVLRN